MRLFRRRAEKELTWFRDDSALAIGVSGLEVPIAGSPFRFFVAMAVDTVAGNLTGAAATVTVYGGPDGTEQMTVPYGQTNGRWFNGKWFKVTGNGAIIELKVATEELAIRPIVVQPA